MKIKILLLFSFFCFSLTYIFAQETLEIRNGKLRAFLSSNGLFSDINEGAWLSLDQDGELIPLVLSSGLWLAGRNAQDEIILNATTFGPSEVSFLIDGFFQVSAEDIYNHIADFEDNGQIDEPIDAIFAWPGRLNPFFSEYNDGLELPNDNTEYGGFWDVDGNGMYDPSMGDYPTLLVRGCDIPVIPTQMTWCAFSIEEEATGNPLYDVRLNLFHFACEEESSLNNSLFSQYIIINRFEEELTDVHWGLFTDFDLGCPSNDYIGSFPERAVAYVYNGTNIDEDCNQIPGFGEHPPIAGVDIIRGPLEIGQEQALSSIMAFNNGGIGNFPPATTDPNTTDEFFNYLQGKWRDGSSLTAGGIGYGGTQEVNFAFPDIPGEMNGWSETQANNEPGDRRTIMSFGPFSGEIGAVNEFIASYSVYEGTASQVENILAFRDQIDENQAFFDGCFQPSDNCMQVLTDIETPDWINSIQIFPNPASNILTIESDQVIQQVRLYDMSGKELLQTKTTTLSVNHLTAGLYYLGIKINGHQLYKKVVIH